MGKIVVVGSCNTDMVVKTKNIPCHGETVLGGTFLMNSGGKGANQAVAIAKLGGNVSFIAKVGNDQFGKQSLGIYKKENINIDHVFLDNENPSGVALITVDEKGENCIVVASGANMNLSIEDIKKARKKIETADFILMQLEIPLKTVEYVAEIAFKKNKKIILNPAPAQHLPSSLLKKIYMITPNKNEAEILSGVKVADWESAKKAAKIISEKGIEIVVITLGCLGALIRDKGQYTIVEAHKVEALDSTSAGDVFNGAVVVALAEGKNIVEAVEFGCKASAISVTRIGAQSSIPLRNEIEN